MSTQLKKEIICPNCSKGNKIDMYVGIDNNINIDFKERILKEDIFDWECPHCKYVGQLVYPMVFCNPQKSYIIALTPVAGKADSIVSIPEIKNVIKRRVKSLAELKEKILILDAGLNDVVIELVKNALGNVIKKSYNIDKLKLYFSAINEDDELEFAVYMDGNKEAAYQSAKLQVYEQSEQVLKSLEYKEPDKFLRVGPTLAQQILVLYKKL